MIRSAKMKAMTPPKEIPPFQSAAANGTLPIEHTKLTMATNGPTTTFSTLVQKPWPWRKTTFQKRVGTSVAREPGDDKADHQLSTQHGEVGHRVGGGVGPPCP